MKVEQEVVLVDPFLEARIGIVSEHVERERIADRVAYAQRQKDLLHVARDALPDLPGEVTLPGGARFDFRGSPVEMTPETIAAPATGHPFVARGLPRRRLPAELAGELLHFVHGQREVVLGEEQAFARRDLPVHVSQWGSRAARQDDLLPIRQCRQQPPEEFSRVVCIP